MRGCLKVSAYCVGNAVPSTFSKRNNNINSNLIDGG